MTRFGLVMIVKNEATIIEKCLSSVSPYISRFDICDTGSTDNTIQVIEKFFETKGIPGKVHRHEWQGFAHNRTLAFKEAEGKSDWMYVIDADDYLLTPLEIPPEHSNAQSLIIDIEEGEYVTQTRQQLFKSGCKWGFASIVHEYPYSEKYPNPNVQQTHKIKVRASRGGDRSKDPLKYWKDAQLLEQDLVRIKALPKLRHWEINMESRYNYYIAQSYFDFRDFASSLKWCESRVKLVGFKEEVYRAYLLKARCLRGLKRPHNEIIKALEECHRYDSYRAEAMFELSIQYELMGEFQKAYDYIQKSLSIKRPKDKFFIVEDYIYDFGNKYKAGMLAKQLGKYEIAYKYLHSLWETTKTNKRHVYELKHQLIKNLVDLYEKIEIIPKKSDRNDIIVNITFSSPDATIRCIKTFLATCIDYIDIDKWYINVLDKKVSETFPWLCEGREMGKKYTINMDDTRVWFHKAPLMEMIYKGGYRILFLNKDGEDDVKNCSDVSGWIKMNGIKKSPYVLANKGEGIWSIDFLTSMVIRMQY